MENIVKDALENDNVVALGPVIYSSTSIQVVHRLIARKPLREATMRSGKLSTTIAERTDTEESVKQMHMTWTEDTTMNEDKKCFQRDVTEIDVSRKGAGRTCMMLV